MIIKRSLCLFVGLFVLYRRLHHWTDGGETEKEGGHLAGIGFGVEKNFHHKSFFFYPHLFPGTSLGWGVYSFREDLLPVRLPSSLHGTLFTVLSSAAMQ